MKGITLVAALMVIVSITGCAPRLIRSSHLDNSADEDHQANREALLELSARPHETPPVFDDDEVAPDVSAREIPVLPITVLRPPIPTLDDPGQIDRARLNDYLDSGPQHFFQTVRLEPIVDEDNFRGFRIAGVMDPTSPVAASGLREGDVITAVNGQNIALLDDFMTLWSTMRSADHLNVDIERGGQAETYSWLIN